jgi:hypothetical protein
LLKKERGNHKLQGYEKKYKMKKKLIQIHEVEPEEFKYEILA